MNPSDYILSVIRTWVPIGVGAAASWLLVTFGLNLDGDAQASLVVFLTAAVTAVYYALVRKLEQRWPAIGRWLLGAGVARTPVYAKPDETVRVEGVLRR